MSKRLAVFLPSMLILLAVALTITLTLTALRVNRQIVEQMVVKGSCL